MNTAHRHRPNLLFSLIGILLIAAGIGLSAVGAHAIVSGGS
jgi:hypothetical protein